MVRDDIFLVFLAVFKERGEPACGRAANYGGFPSPPKAAKCVRTIFNIRSHRGKINTSPRLWRGWASEPSRLQKMSSLRLIWLHYTTKSEPFSNKICDELRPLRAHGDADVLLRSDHHLTLK